MSSTHSHLLFHLVFRTGHGRPLINPAFGPELHAYLAGIVKADGEQVLAIGGMEDHVHLLMRLRPSHQISEVVRRIKGGSSKWINDKGVCPQRFHWQRGYGIFSVSQSNMQFVKNYILSQKEHHRRYSFRQEYVALLEKHGLDVDGI